MQHVTSPTTCVLSNTLLILAIVAALPRTSLAAGSGCELMCNGHGTCNKDSRCDCFAGWDGELDCSLRSCPYGHAWAGTLVPSPAFSYCLHSFPIRFTTPPRTTYLRSQSVRRPQARLAARLGPSAHAQVSASALSASASAIPDTLAPRARRLHASTAAAVTDTALPCGNSPSGKGPTRTQTRLA